MSSSDNAIQNAIPYGFLAAAIMSIACALPTIVRAAPPSSPTSSLHQLSSALETLTNRASPAVVEILVTGYGAEDPESHNPNAPIGRERSEGSGVIVDPDGYIVTNYHVIAGQQRIKVVITPTETGGAQAPAALRVQPRILPAQVVGVSKFADLAVLKIKASGLPTIPFADYRKLHQGQLVLALGSPIGLKNSVSMGVVSAVLRQDNPESPMVYIQTDAAINPGNSGGALINVDGELVGINASILTQSGGNEGIGFAIPSGIVQFVYRQIRHYGHVRNGYIGASVQAITPELASALHLPQTTARGVIVSDVMPRSPAAAAGVKIYDRILSIDGAPVDSVPTFVMNIYLRKNGDRVRLGVVRDGEQLSLMVPVHEVEPHATSLADLANPAVDAIAQLGIVGVDLTPAAAEFLAPPRMDSGVAIAAILTGSRAAAIGLHVGDIIHAVDGKPVTDMRGLRSTLAALKPGQAVALQIGHNQRLKFVTFEAE